MISAVVTTLLTIGVSMVAVPEAVLVVSAIIARGHRRRTVELIVSVCRYTRRRMIGDARLA